MEKRGAMPVSIVQNFSDKPGLLRLFFQLAAEYNRARAVKGIQR
jgi:hypothetical protein